jgi:hypothetical protein
LVQLQRSGAIFQSLADFCDASSAQLSHVPPEPGSADGWRVPAQSERVVPKPSFPYLQRHLTGVNALLVASVGDRNDDDNRAVLVDRNTAHHHDRPRAGLLSAFPRIQGAKYAPPRFTTYDFFCASSKASQSPWLRAR